MDDAIRSRDEPIRTGAVRTGFYLTLGVVLTAIGLIGVGIYAFAPRITPAEGDAQADAGWQSGVIIGAAVCTGVGVLLLLLALVAAVRSRREHQPG